ncbi:conserved hypothetical protein [Candidatus Zixiibacteriota bacterium]|nr:conserved hypothetical protein [candidate division Zixibacteria bacterium]
MYKKTDSDSEFCLVKKDYKAAYPDPLIAFEGDTLLIGKEDTEYPGWIWCKNFCGKSGWVPKNYISINHNRAILLRDYDATELSVSTGERLIILKEESGWYWCRNKNDQKGWVPRRNISVI